MAEFKFTNDIGRTDCGNVMALLRSPRLWIPTQHDYPDYDDWLLKTETDIANDTKRAMLAYAGSAPVGVVVYQQAEDILQIRNISLSPDARGRHIGSFLVKNVEIEGSEHDFPGCKRVVVDTKATNTDMINFLIGAGYGIESIEDLYGLGAGMDTVLSKPLQVTA